MISFEPAYFQKFGFRRVQVQLYMKSALHDLEIARKDRFPEVCFTYSYQALIKAGIALIAVAGFKVRSIPGHHVKILEKIAEILERADVSVIGNTMRMKRNSDFYSGGEPVGEKETQDYLEFVGEILLAAQELMKK